MEQNADNSESCKVEIPGNNGIGILDFSVSMENLSSVTGVCKGACNCMQQIHLNFQTRQCAFNWKQYQCVLTFYMYSTGHFHNTKKLISWCTNPSFFPIRK